MNTKENIKQIIKPLLSVLIMPVFLIMAFACTTDFKKEEPCEFYQFGVISNTPVVFKVVDSQTKLPISEATIHFKVHINKLVKSGEVCNVTTTEKYEGEKKSNTSGEGNITVHAAYNSEIDNVTVGVKVEKENYNPDSKTILFNHKSNGELITLYLLKKNEYP